MEVLAPAKLNLFLELIERRDDGFHELETVMTSIRLFDRILLRRRTDDRFFLSQAPRPPNSNLEMFSMPSDRTNLVWQAIDLLKQKTGQRFGLDVEIQKNIPSQAGMGGGSSDAAAMLVAANRLLDLRLAKQQLIAIANQLGSDVAFFIDGFFAKPANQNSGFQTARCLGRGELVQNVQNNLRSHFVIAMPPQGLSTAQVYQHSEVANRRRDSQALLNGCVSGSFRPGFSGLFNRLQTAAGKLSPWVAKLSNEFQRTGCSDHQMTGSGAAWFGMFQNRLLAKRAARKLTARLPDCSLFCVSSVGNDANLIRYRAE